MKRTQAGAIPFRRKKGRLSFCLITTSDGAKWGFPKGIIEPGDTAGETALKETREEAGLRGEIDDTPVGSFRQTKWGTNHSVDMYLMKVTRVDDNWPEEEVRDRRWCDRTEAADLLRGRPVEPVFARACRKLSK